MKFILQMWMQLAMPSFFGIGMGPSQQESQQYGDLASLANFATSEGEGDILASDNFYKAILSGDPSKVSAILGPEFSAINKQGQENKKTMFEFGNRGGGTNAGAQSIGDKIRSSVDSILASFKGNAVSALGGRGEGLLGTGAAAHEGAFGEANVLHKEHSAKINDIFKSIAELASSVVGGFGGAKALSLAYPGGAAQVAGSSGGSLAQPIDSSYTGAEEIS